MIVDDSRMPEGRRKNKNTKYVVRGKSFFRDRAASHGGFANDRLGVRCVGPSDGYGIGFVGAWRGLLGVAWGGGWVRVPETQKRTDGVRWEFPISPRMASECEMGISHLTPKFSI